jgi:class 3 adenylate cyclase
MEATVIEPTSLFERMVDRYIDITAWPAARKTAFLMVIALPFHLAFLLVTHLSLRSSDVIRVDDFEALQGVWLLGICATIVIAWWAGRRGGGAPWTVYLMIVAYGTPVALLVHAQGTWSTPFIVFFPQTILLLTLFYDARTGAYGLAYGTFLFLGLSAAELSGHLPYAPLFRERAIEAPLALPWVFTQAAFVMLVFLYYTSVLRFSEGARERQRQRLEIAHRELGDARARLEHFNELIRRYVPSQLAEHLLGGGSTGHERPERRRVTILSSDVEGFTQIADRLEPEDLAALLNEYLGEMARIAEEHGGMVEQFVGDGITVLFGVPIASDDRDHARRAVHAARAMQLRVGELQRRWLDDGMELLLRVRIGINTGIASVGSFGSTGRMTYSAVGTQTNLAARIQAHCPPGGVLVSHATWALVREQFSWIDRGELEVKGIHFPVHVHEMAGEAGGTPPERRWLFRSASN